MRIITHINFVYDYIKAQGNVRITKENNNIVFTLSHLLDIIKIMYPQ